MSSWLEVLRKVITDLSAWASPARSIPLPAMRTSIFCCAVLSAHLVSAGVCPASDDPARQEDKKYALVVSEQTWNAPKWKEVCNILRKKHSARMLVYADKDPWTVKSELAAYEPWYVCILAQPEEATRGFVKDVIRLIRALDEDPYEDAIWAILTGYDASDALRIARATELELRRSISHVGSGWLDFAAEGISFDEGQKNVKYVKTPGEATKRAAGPDDTTKELASELNTNAYDMMSSSGHATEHDWQLGYSYKDGQFISHDGQLFGVDTAGNRYPIMTTNPKVYFSPGNCLIGHISDKDCMVLAWMHSGGVNQFFGHTGPQYRVCHAWGIADYFLELQGRFTFAESVYLNRQAQLDYIGRLPSGASTAEKMQLESCYNGTVLYGDPAWAAKAGRVCTPPYSQTLDVTSADEGTSRIRFTVKTNKEVKSSPRPPAAFLPFRVKDVKVESTNAERVVCADNFILMYLPSGPDKTLGEGQSIQAVLTAHRGEKAGTGKDGFSKHDSIAPGELTGQVTSRFTQAEPRRMHIRSVVSVKVTEGEADYLDIYLAMPGYGWVPVDPSAAGDSPKEARDRGFGTIPDTDMILTLSGGDSEYLAMMYNSNISAEIEPSLGMPSFEVSRYCEWTPIE